MPRKIPQDMIPGVRHTTKNYGDVEIVEYINASKVIAKFIDTGYEFTTQSGNIRNGNARDHSDMQQGVKHLTKNYGVLEIVKWNDSANVTVRFVDTGYITKALAKDIRSGNVKDKLRPSVHGKGYVGNGSHLPSKNGKATAAYDCWHSMLRRCYCEKSIKKNPTYSDCTVDDVWFNFQNFAEWYDKNYPRDGKEYHLDKDIKVKGNRIYSPETCMFVTRKENNIAAWARHYRFKSPTGEIFEVYNLSEFCEGRDIERRNMCAVHLGRQSHHKGWTKA